jgi:hypothetical protein
MAEPTRGLRLFGFEIKRTNDGLDDPKKKPSIVPARDDDGAGYVTFSVDGTLTEEYTITS